MTMQKTYELTPTLEADLAEFKEQVARFGAGEISAIAFRAFRVPQGVYEQREDGTHMLRVRMPAGRMLPKQMRTLAAVSRKYGSDLLHITTRQDMQIHKVPLENIQPALVELFHGGLSTKGGGGNTVRNITACSDAGVCPKEVFDVSGHAVAVTEFLLPDPANYQLPRKYKISFAGCPVDCVGSAVNDVGFVAVDGDSGPGFAVYAGGGLGPHAQVGQLLEKFIALDQAHIVAEAIKRVFDKHGNRKNKQRARMRYLVEEKGFENFRKLYQQELALIRENPPTAPVVRELPECLPRAPDSPQEPIDGFDKWRQANVIAQKQDGFHIVLVPVFLGEIPLDTFEKLANIAERYGEGMIRTTPTQNLALRWVPTAALPGLHRELAEQGLATAGPPVSREMIACTGAATCKLGICLSQGLAEAIRKELESSSLDLTDAQDLRLNLNGCPNSCGRHSIASIGLVGLARRVGDHLVPYYNVQLGGRLGVDQTKLAEGKELLPARNLPGFVVDYLRAFRESPQYPNFDAFLEHGGREVSAKIADNHKQVPPFAEDRNYYYDWGAEELFSLAGRGPGECSAGVFDLISVDMASARAALKDGDLLSATANAARALLITRGEQAKDVANALELFEKHFLDEGLVDGSLRELVASARKSVGTANRNGFSPARDQVSALIGAVEQLYESMDQSLRFHPAACSTSPKVSESEDTSGVELADISIDREADFQGVTCPLNYVKTKLLLGQMSTGQVLSILLDDAGGRSVPQSAEKDGHKVLFKEKQGDRYRVILQKG